MKGFKFRRQHPIGEYIVDFICLKAKLVIELDGGQHNEAKQMDNDVKRTIWLEAQGLRIVRFWNDEVLTNLSGVQDVIWNALSPPP